jgi:ubiquinol-cytochrome c reductase cytochrome c1 subunit
MLRTRIAVLAAGLLALAIGAQPAQAKTREMEPKKVPFSFDAPLGKYDQAALQRGYKVYAEVCSSCHSMNLMFYRNLCQQGGPFYDSKHPNPIASPYCKSIAADIKVPDIDQDTGDAITRPATPADHFKSPYPNANAAAAANGGAAPPDLSLIVKAREGGARYVYSLLTGYVNPPAGLRVTPGKYYNPYYPGDLGSFWSGPKNKVPEGGFISMPFQLTPGRVTFDDGTKSTTEQQAHDVVTFLSWASEPKQEEREQTGVAVMAYLILFAGITFVSYKRIWRNIAH